MENLSQPFFISVRISSVKFEWSFDNDKQTTRPHIFLSGRNVLFEIYWIGVKIKPPSTFWRLWHVVHSRDISIISFPTLLRAIYPENVFSRWRPVRAQSLKIGFLSTGLCLTSTFRTSEHSQLQQNRTSFEVCKMTTALRWLPQPEANNFPVWY